MDRYCFLTLVNPNEDDPGFVVIRNRPKNFGKLLDEWQGLNDNRNNGDAVPDWKPVLEWLRDRGVEVIRPEEDFDVDVERSDTDESEAEDEPVPTKERSGTYRIYLTVRTAVEMSTKALVKVMQRELYSHDNGVSGSFEVETHPDLGVFFVKFERDFEDDEYFALQRCPSDVDVGLNLQLLYEIEGALEESEANAATGLTTLQFGNFELKHGPVFDSSVAAEVEATTTKTLQHLKRKP
jgi:hypothetical protein